MKIIKTEIVKKQLKGINNKIIDFNVKVKDELTFNSVISCFNEIKRLSSEFHNVNITVECDQKEWEILQDYIHKQIV